MKNSRFAGRSVRAILLLIAWALPAAAGSGSTYDFLRSDVSARAGALGGSFVSATADPNLIFYNPAGLATMDRRRLSFSYFKHLLDINSASAAYADEIPGFGFVAAGVTYVNYGEFDRTGPEGQNLGTFGAGEFGALIAYAGRLGEDVRYGAGVEFVYSSISEYSSSAVAVDLGVQYDAVRDRVVVGASLLHLGTQIDPYATIREDLPLDLKVGVSLYPEHLPAVLMVDLHRLTDRRDSFGDRFRAFSVGVEFTLSPNVYLRTGYNHERRQDLRIGTGSNSGLAGFSIGAGVSTGDYQFDYGYSSNGPVGSFHRFSLSF